MTKQDFISELQKNLSGNLSSGETASHVNYYMEYIESEVRKGKTEEEVTESLGNPRLLAKSIIEAASYSEASGSSVSENKINQNSEGNRRKIPGWLFILAGILVLILLFVIATSIISMLLPILIPAFIILMVVYYFKKKE